MKQKKTRVPTNAELAKEKRPLTEDESNAKGGGDPEQPPDPGKGMSVPGSTFEDQGRPV